MIYNKDGTNAAFVAKPIKSYSIKIINLSWSKRLKVTQTDTYSIL